MNSKRIKKFLKSYVLICVFFIISILSGCQTDQVISNNPKDNKLLTNEQSLMRFMRRDILFGAAKYHLIPDTRNIDNYKAISFSNINEKNSFTITMDKKFEGHDDDWLRIGEQNQRWELANKDNPIYLSRKPIYIKYKFKISDHSPNGTGGTFFQIIANNNKSRILPWLKLKYDNNKVQIDLNLVKEVFWLNGDTENTNFDKKSYRFSVGDFADFKESRTFKFKILPSRGRDGELIVWLDNKKIFELYGPNFTIGNAYSFKLGYYRWLDFQNNVETGKLTINSFGYHKNCNIVLSISECEYLPQMKFSSTSVPYRLSHWRSEEHGKSVTKVIKYTKKIPDFVIKKLY